MSDLTGQTIGSYHLVEKLGAGGMAEVYKAYQPRLDRYVALKFIRPEFITTADFLRRFEQEAKLLARLNHPHIVHIYDFGEEDSRCYLVMEYVSGGTLKEWLRPRSATGQSPTPGAVTPEQVLAILQQISAALDYAHQQGIIHRDIKPANIMLTADGRALLSDFGLAKLLSGPGELTQTGSTSGTPAYMSPEQINGKPDEIGPASDLYSWGVVLYELLTGRVPFLADTPLALMLKHVQEIPPSPRTLNPALTESVERILLKTLAKAPGERYQRAGDLAQAFTAAVEATRSIYHPDTASTMPRIMWWSQTQSDTAPASGDPPFKGLHYFDEADAALFFGRELLTARLIARLGGASSQQGSGGAGELERDFSSTQFLAVVGASGSGKSSLVRAGLIPALRRGEPLADGTIPPASSAEWPIHIITPTAHPLESLAGSLTRDSESVTATATLMDDLVRDPRSLHLYIRRLVGQTAGEISSAPFLVSSPPRLLLVVDQFEELFTLCRDEAERQAFIDNLLTASLPALQPSNSSTFQPITLVVITLRADFYAHCAQYDHLREALARQQEYIGPMNTVELRRAIEEPAKQGDWTFEPGLVDLLLEEVGAEPGSLPLLSHALLETWQRRRGRLLTFGGYRESGGVRGAIAKTADRVWSQLEPAEQAIARNIFLRLTELGEGTQDTRRRVARNELEALTEDQRPGTGESGPEKSPVSSVLQTLADARLITTDEETVEVAHEALIREWPLLRQWLDENRESLYLHRHLTEAAQAWEKLNRDPGELYRGARLVQASEWAQSHAEEMNASEREFLAASQELARQHEAEREAQRRRELEAAQKLAEAEQRRAEEQSQATQRLRQRAVFLAGALVIAGILAIVAIIFGQRANQNAQQALAERTIAEAEAHSRATAQANAEIQQQEAEKQARFATSRELAAASVKNLEVNPELSILLALQAITTTYVADDGLVLPEALDALHQALPASRVRLTLTGHTDWVYWGTFSPDDTRLATSDESGVSKVWDAATGQELFSVPGYDATFSLNDGGKRLVTVSEGQITTITTWRAADGEAVNMVTVQVDTEEKSFWLNSDWTRLAVWDADGTGSIWDATMSVAQSKPLLRLVGHTDEIRDMAFSLDGTRWATTSNDGTARIWEASTGNLLFTLTGHTNNVRSVTFSPDGRYLATFGDDATVKIWETATGREWFSFVAGGDGEVTFSPDGLHLATRQDTAVKVWDLTAVLQADVPPTLNAAMAADITNKVLWLKGHQGGVIFSIAFNSDGTRLLSTGFDKTARVWDVSPAGAKEWLTLAGHRNDREIRDVEFSPDGLRLATASLDSIAKVWDANTGQELFTLAGHTGYVQDVTFSPDGERLATASADHTAKIWDAFTGQELFTLAGHTDLVTKLAFSPDGARLATVSYDRTAKIWDTLTGRELLTLPEYKDDADVASVAFTPDGTRLVTGYGYGTAKIWDALTGQDLFTLTGQTIDLPDVVFSPDGTRLATASYDGSVKIWQTATGQELFTLTRDHQPVNGVAFSPDGTRLAAASLGSRVIVWDISNAPETGTTRGHELLTLPSQGYTVAFSPDGRLLATDGADNTVRIYLLPVDELLPLAYSRLTRTWSPEECQEYLHQEMCPAWP